MKQLLISVLLVSFALANSVQAQGAGTRRRAPNPTDGANKPPLAADESEKKILAHNTTNAGASMQDYLKAVTANPKLETLFIHKDFRGIGVTLVKK